MPVENGLMTQPRRGRAITVRTPGRAPFIEAAQNPLLDDVAAEPAEDDLLELEGADEEEENEETPPQHDDSEELEMWMRQTRRAQLLTPEQEVHLAVRVMAKELADKGKNAELLRLLQRSELAHMGRPTELTPMIIRRIESEVRIVAMPRGGVVPRAFE